MLRVDINASPPYAALIGRGLLPACGELLRAQTVPCRCLLVADETVNALYGEQAAASLAQAGFNVSRYTLPKGEQNKNLAQIEHLLEALSEAQLSRGDVVVALGGGLTGDMAGLAAALYLRGIAYINIPTTLLAAVDAAVGGKTAVNLAAGKNLAGAFHQPSLVICDCDTFATLPTQTWQEGLAECIKYAMLGDTALLTRLSNGSYMEDVPALVARCLEIKAGLVEADMRDNAERRLMNFGHTVGHAIEQCSSYSISHGEAVAMGMGVITRAALKRGFCNAACLTALTQAIQACGLPLNTSFTAEQLAQAARHDKKRRGEVISLILPVEPGHCIVHSLPLTELPGFIADGLEAPPCPC